MARVPCVNATLWEVNRDKHFTDDKLQPCENCATVLAALEHRRKVAEDLDFELI